MRSLRKKRRKSSRMHGSHTHGRGFKKKARGSGHRGGFGNAGTGKRADQKKTLVLNMPEAYFGKSGLRAKVKRYKILNVGDLEKMSNGKKDLDLSKYKLLGKGEVKSGFNIKVYSASKSAVEKVKKAGGKVELKIQEE